MAAGKRDLKMDAFWRRVFDGQAGSGLTIRAWCRQQGLSEARFYRWRRKLLRDDEHQQQPLAARGAKPTISDFADGQQQEPWAGRGVKRKPSARPDGRNKRSAFVPVQVARDKLASTDPDTALSFAERSGGIEIVLTAGCSIRLHGLVDRQMLADVLEMLTPANSPGSEQPGSKTAPLEPPAC